jgi:hypothetical protein
MTDPTSYLAVDYAQINCSGDTFGEAAIIMLVKRLRSPPPNARRGRVLAATIVDFGAFECSVQMIMNRIGAIQRAYTLDSPQLLQFKSLVATHWDQDHVNGLCVGPDSFFGRLNWDPNHPNKAERFYYNSHTNAPETVFYCQDLEPPQVSLQINPWAVVTTSKDKTKTVRLNPTLLCRTVENTLGVNVFNNRGLQTKHPWLIGSLEDLLRDNPPWDEGSELAGAPGLYIVGANGVRLGEKYQMDNEGVVVKREFGLTSKVGVINKATGTDTNLRSLVLLLVWMPDNAQNQREIRVSLYTGGDAEYVMEEKIQAWLNPGNNRNYTIKIVKAGHHGGQYSTSTNFIESVDPDYYILSPGRLYGHPCK